MPGPMIQSLLTARRSIGQWCAFSTSITLRSGGAIRSTRCSAVRLKLITRAGESSPRPAEVAQQLDDPALDEPAVPRRMLGLDGQLDATTGVGDGLQQLAQREDLALLRVARRAPRRRGLPTGSSRRRSRARRAPRGSSWRSTPLVAAVLPRSRSCTQTRWPSAVSRTSHSSASARTSIARCRPARCARRSHGWRPDGRRPAASCLHHGAATPIVAVLPTAAPWPEDYSRPLTRSSSRRASTNATPRAHVSS